MSNRHTSHADAILPHLGSIGSAGCIGAAIELHVDWLEGLSSGFGSICSFRGPSCCQTKIGFFFHQRSFSKLVILETSSPKVILEEV